MAADAPPTPAPIRQIRAPRPGELTTGWRGVTAVGWLGVLLSLGSVWRASDQLGLSTWWLGPRGDPNPRLVQVLPFVPAVLMLLAAINRVRYTAWFGLGASAVIVAIGAGDIARVFRLGLVEVSIGLAAATLSLASLTGTYHTRPTQ